MSKSSQRRVTLVLDRWGISSATGQRVADFATERDAFRQIEVALRRSSTTETIQQLTFIVDPCCWEHFRSYRSISGVEVREVTPLGELRKLCQAELPPWLSDDEVWRWGLLHRELPSEWNPAAWEASIATWLVPGLIATSTLADWFRCMSSANDFPSPFKCEPVNSWIASKFSALASKEVTSRDVVDELLSALNSANSPFEFATEWAERVALLPLLDADIDNPLRSTDVARSTARQRVLARYLPLVFPLHEPLHARTSEAFCAALRQSRLRESKSFERAVLQLNAVWEKVAEELGVWLDITPQAMTLRAATHLSELPGYDFTQSAARLVNDLSPPETVPSWNGLGHDFVRWTASYSNWLRRMFLRRELPSEQDDPATGFARWLKDNVEVCFNHPERSYLRIGQSIREALRNNRVVVLVLVDALACQVAPTLTDQMSEMIGHPPSQNSYLFAPIPTISEVAKAAVITGSLPDAGTSVSVDSLTQSYEIPASEIVLASNWTDAERVQVSSTTRLVVYRDNRLDDQLSSASTFKGLLQDAANIFPRISRLVTRWVNDLRSLTGSAPIVIVTADHGFTFGPPPGSETTSMRKLDGAHRCAAVEDGQKDSFENDPSVTLLDRKRLHLRSNYIAARGRYFGRGTLTGWRLSHGGLLPEEVLIPHIEWFGTEAPVEWPTIRFPDGVRRERGQWLARVEITNDAARSLDGVTVHLRVVGHDIRVVKDIPKLSSGARATHELALDGPEQEGAKELPIDVLLRQRVAGQEVEIDRCYHVPKQRQLVERTAEQDKFEDMF